MEGFNEAKGLPNCYAVAIIGAGVIGCAICRQLTLAGVECILLEKTDTPLSGSSAGNSGIFHTGFDAEPGTIEAQCMREGWNEFKSLRKKINIPYEERSALVVAHTSDDLRQLPELLQKAHKNGVSKARIISASEVLSLEPNLNPNIEGGLLVPGEAVVDPFLLPLFYLGQAIENKAKVICNCEVLEGSLKKYENGAKYWTLKTNRTDAYSTIDAQVVVNCAGLRGDIVESISRTPQFNITPRKGQFLVYDSSVAHLVNTILAPVPSQQTKGVLMLRTVHGMLLVGPTADDTDERESPEIHENVTQELQRIAEEKIPTLVQHRDAIVGTYAGLRPSTQYRDYQIRASKKQQWVTVAGIRSTGLTAALGIAHYVLFLFRNTLGVITAPIKTAQQNQKEGKKLLKRLMSQLTNGTNLVKINDSNVFRVTHPLTVIGHKGHSARL